MIARTTPRRWPLAGALLLVLAGCSTAKPADSGKNPRPTPASASPAAAAPDDLVGMWKVTGAAGEPASSVLRIGPTQQAGSFILFRSCGEFIGGWVAGRSGGFLGELAGYSMTCLSSVGTGDPNPAWLAATRSFTVKGSERELLAADGRVLARLLPGGKARANKDMLASRASAPVLSAADRQALHAAARALPADAPAASVTGLIGRWKPYPVRHYGTAQQPYLAFATDGQWSGSDGCNKLGGTWRLGPAGELLTLSGPVAGVGCNGAPVGQWLPSSGRAVISGTVLTLYASNGNVLSRLTR